MRAALIRGFLAAAICLHLGASSPAAQTLDFDVYRARVEPIFLKLREPIGPGGSCFMCHTHVNTRFRLQPVSRGTLTWTEAQSRQNFERVMALVTPGDPMSSRLLLHSLAIGAGGDPIHAGGKHWQSRDDPEWQTLAAWVSGGAAVGGRAPGGATSGAAGRAPTAETALDFERFKARVQPVFLDKRPGLARCYVCHSQGTNFRLQPLPAGRTAWTDEESRRNLEAVRRLVVPGDPRSSRLLMMPLAAEAGGDPFHPGGKRWASETDPEWQALAAWVRGAK
jgi:hypothetical protein